MTILVIVVVSLNLAAAAVVYWRAVVTGTPRWAALYIVLLLGPLALPLLVGTTSTANASRAAGHGGRPTRSGS